MEFEKNKWDFIPSPEAISAISSLSLKAKLVVDGFISGLHKSPHKGSSVEFAEHRDYQYGDELRNVDWNTFARTDKFYVKQYEEDTNMRVFILLDASGSMAFPENRPSKLDYARLLAASLSYLILKQRDSAGLAIFDQKIRTFLPPRSDPSHFHKIVQILQDMHGEGETGISASLTEISRRITRRALIIILSDLWDDQQKLIEACVLFKHQKNELLLFHILDPAEIDFTLKDETLLVDQETWENIRIDPGGLSELYREKMDKFLKNLEFRFLEQGIDYKLIRTDIPYHRALYEYLGKRQSTYAKKGSGK